MIRSEDPSASYSPQSCSSESSRQLQRLPSRHQSLPRAFAARAGLFEPTEAAQPDVLAGAEQGSVRRVLSLAGSIPETLASASLPAPWMHVCSRGELEEA